MIVKTKYKMIKKIVTLFIFIGCSFAHGQSIQWIPFEWASDSYSGRYFDKVAINVPVQIEDISDNLYMQLDLGAITTVIYEKSFAPYLSLHKNLLNRIDTTLTFTIEGKTNPKFRGMNMKLGDMEIGEHNIGLFQNYGPIIPKDSIGNSKSKHIGTLGPDIFKDKVLVINFPEQKISILSSVNELPKEDIANIKFIPFQESRNRIKIPMKINGKIEQVLYDTGASIFPLNTSKEIVMEFPNSTITDSLKVNSWGEKITFYGVQLGSPVSIGNQSFSNVTAYYDERSMASDFFKRENIWGFAGNVLFLDKTLVIDYINKTIGISQ